jgi:hypothetical protein
VKLDGAFGDEAAVLAEDLQTIVDAVADIDETVLVNANAMHRVAELLRWRASRIIGRRLLVARLVAVGTPVSLVGANLGIEHHHPAVGVAVGSEHFLRRDIDRDVGGRAKPLGRIAVVALALLADLQDELAVHGEFEQLPIPLAVAGEPDEVVVESNCSAGASARTDRPETAAAGSLTGSSWPSRFTILSTNMGAGTARLPTK